MSSQRAYFHLAEGLSRRQLLHMGLAAGLTVSALPSPVPCPSGVPKRASPSAAASYACVAKAGIATRSSKGQIVFKVLAYYGMKSRPVPR